MGFRAAHLLVFLLASLVPSAAWAGLVSGFVTEKTGTPIASATVDIIYPGTSTIAASATTDISGWYELEVRDATYDVEVVPPMGSNYLPQRLGDIDIDGDLTMNLVLVPARPVTVTGVVVDRAGATLTDVDVCLYATIGGLQLCARTDAEGEYELEVTTGDYQLITSGSPTTGVAPNSGFYVRRYAQLRIVDDLAQNVVVDAFLISGTLRDEGGEPVDGVQVRGYTSLADSDRYQYGSASAMTNEEGRFEVALLDGTGYLDLTPPADSGLGKIRHTLGVAEDDDLTLALPDPATVSGVIEDRTGDALSFVSACLYPVPSGPATCSTSDADGQYSLVVPPGTYEVALSRGSSANGIAPRQSFSWRDRQDITITDDETRNLVLQAQIITGMVVDQTDAPVSGATLVGYSSSSSSEQNGWGHHRATTDDDGLFALYLFDGNGWLDVVPPSGAELVPFRRTLGVAGDTDDLDISWPAAITMSGTTVDRDGLGIFGAYVCLRSVATGFRSCTNSGDRGAYSLSVVPDNYRVELSGSSSTGIVPNESFFQRENTAFSMSDNVVRDLTIDGAWTSGRVVDADGNAVEGVLLRNYSSRSTSETYQYSRARTSTGSTGRFEFAALRGAGYIDALPADSLGLADFRLSDLTFAGDQTMGILLQFLSDSVEEDIDAGESVTTDDEGDGATASDPIETTVTSPNAGTITIHEAPISEREPDGYRFLTQQINITAPPADADAPLEFIFTMDSSRIPAGYDPSLISIFRNGARVEPCDRPGVLDPDPCVTSREVLADGDLELVVLTSEASAWNLGVPLALDEDEDGIPDEADECPDDPEDYDGFDDADGCPDPDNDEDGIEDELDACPDDPEDIDGFEDDDGCPDEDNDDDGVTDDEDACPNEPEDHDYFEDDDGCPDADNDGDGLADELDECPNDPEDADGFEDEDGCPDPDNDGDGVPDMTDQCPDTPEDLDGDDDEDGCPEEDGPSCDDVDGIDGWTNHDVHHIIWRLGRREGQVGYWDAADLDASGQINWIDLLMGLERYYRCR